MELSIWLKKKGRGAIARLSKETNVSTQTIHAVLNGRPIGRYKIAKLISEATEGEVSIGELCEPDGGIEMPTEARKVEQDANKVD